jgi:amino acid transporter
MLGFVVNALLGFFVLMTVIFTLGDIETILATPTGYPFLQIFYNTTKSLTGTNIMAAIIIINLTASSIAVLATASRQLWAFARNKGLPFSSMLAPAILPHQLPLNALFVSLVITILLSLINIGSSAALNAIYSLNAGSLLTSYMITISCMLFRRLQGHKLPPSRWSLGRWGLPINIGAICYLLPVYVFSFFPGVVNPTPVTMNWGIVMYSGVVIFSTLYYIFRGRFHYQPPKEQVRGEFLKEVELE